MNPVAIFFFGFIAGVALMLVVFQVCLASIKRSIRCIREIEELEAEARRRFNRP